MRIGVYFTPEKEQGGVYQYSVSFLETLFKIKNNEYVVISASKDIPQKFRRAENFKIINLARKRREFAFRLRDLASYIFAVVFSRSRNIFSRLRLFDLITPFYRLSQWNVI